MRHALLPADPDDEELTSTWNLSEDDLVQVYRCRGDDMRFSFALQLCTLRRYGRFLGDDYDSVPVRIANHVGHQLGLPPVLIAVPPAREATDLGHERRIRDYLRFKSLDAVHRELLERHLRDLAKDVAAQNSGVRRSRICSCAAASAEPPRPPPAGIHEFQRCARRLACAACMGRDDRGRDSLHVLACPPNVTAPRAPEERILA